MLGKSDRSDHRLNQVCWKPRPKKHKRAMKKWKGKRAERNKWEMNYSFYYLINFIVFYYFSCRAIGRVVMLEEAAWPALNRRQVISMWRMATEF